MGKWVDYVGQVAFVVLATCIVVGVINGVMPVSYIYWGTAAVPEELLRGEWVAGLTFGAAIVLAVSLFFCTRYHNHKTEGVHS